MKSVLSSSKMTTDTSRRRMLKDNSWIRRDPDEDEPVDDDPNFGKVVLGRLKSSGDDVDGTPVNYGTSVTSITKNTTTTNTKSSLATPTSPTKPPVAAKNTAVKTSPTSSFTARVFSANTNNKTSSPVKKSGEKLSEVSASQILNRQDKTFSLGPSSPVAVNIVPPPPVPPITPATSVTVKSPPPLKSPIRNENVSFSYDSPNSSVTTTKRTVTSSSILDETRTTKLSEKTTDSYRLSDVSYSTSYTSPSSETLSTRYYTSSSAPLDNLADTLIPTRSGSVLSPPAQSRYDRDITESRYDRDMPESRYSRDITESRYDRDITKSGYDRDITESRYDRDMIESRTQRMSYEQPISTVSQTLYSPTKTTFSEVSSSRSVSSRDFCTVCGKPIAGGPRMILEDLKIFSHTACFKCSMCQTDLGNLEAGRTIWVYRDRVNCPNCYSKTKSKWYI